MQYKQFLRTLPPHVFSHLSPSFALHTRQPWSGIIQFYDRDVRIHYEVQRVARLSSLELGLHFESKNKQLNRQLYHLFQRHLTAIKAELGERFEADLWDRGWTKVYELFPDEGLTAENQAQVGRRLAEIITYFHPILAQAYR